MLHIEKMNITDDIEIYNLLQTIGVCENEFKNTAYGLSFLEYKKWLVEQDAWSKGECLPEGFVPQSIFWLYDDLIPVGMGKIRHKLNKHSRAIGGNIGYAIGANYRGKGYATELLKLLVNKAKSMGITEVLLSVEKYNPASKRVIEKAGGTLFDENIDRWYFNF